ncbi:MAG TPA: VOC family protein [Streptosporangiaceae bacterium]|nr:VOC family protein [Streptosporangiaceae bacterium]
MTDPFEALREPVTPVDPDPDFAGRLRRRLTREVLASSGGTMSQETISTQPAQPSAAAPSTAAARPAAARPAASRPAAARPAAARPSALTPYIVVADARRALDWYGEVFGAQRRGQLYVNADGTIGHAEVSIGHAVLMFSEVSDLWPDVPVRAPENPATFSHTLHLEVDDVDASTDRARRNGAAVEREPVDQPYGRGAVIVDPFGHRWMLLRPPTETGVGAETGAETETETETGAGAETGGSETRATWAGAAEPSHCEIGNITMLARDTQQTKEFYEAVLGVSFFSGHPGAWRTEQTSPPLGIMPSTATAPAAGAPTEVQLSYRVDDITATIERVRAADGHANEPVRRPYGLLAECVDNQGATFRLWQPS